MGTINNKRKISKCITVMRILDENALNFHENCFQLLKVVLLLMQNIYIFLFIYVFVMFL